MAESGAMTMQQPLAPGWREEGSDLLRGLAGGFLVGIPLLYTMETWWLGMTVSPLRSLIFLGAAYALNVGFVTWAGFRRGENGSRRPFGDALEATALAAAAATVTLVLLHQIRLDHPLGTIIGTIAVNTIPISLGVAIANHLLAPDSTPTGSESGGEATDEPGTGEDKGKGSGGRPPPAPPGGPRATLIDLGAAFAGAIFLSFSIAPTQELPMLATAIPTLGLPWLILFSLALTYGIVFVAGFEGQEARRASRGLFQRPSTETIVAYLVSLATCALMLWLFGQFESGVGTEPFVAYEEVIILGLPAAVGAAAGRLAV